MATDLKLAPQYLKVLDYIHLTYTKTGLIPKNEIISHWASVDPKVVESFWTDDYCKAALLERGIDPNLEGDRITPEQVAAVALVTNVHDKRSLSRKLKALNISDHKWNGWLKNPTFQGYIREVSQNAVVDNSYLADVALVQQVDRGDLRAIAYMNQMTGKFDPNAAANVNVPQLLMKVFGVIQQHVKDPEAIDSIGKGILALVESSTPVANKVLEIT
jgi:hypothetical protein